MRAWHQAHGAADSALAIDGKTSRGAIDAEGKQAHVLGIVGHDTKPPWGQKVGMRPDADEGEKRTNGIGTVTADALLTRRARIRYLLGRGAVYMFTVNGNPPK